MSRNSREKLSFFSHQILPLLFCLVLLGACSSSKNLRKQNVNKVVETARSYRGTPYRYGGTTRSGMDCSALVYHSFYSVGINMPRTSEAQSKEGKKVPGNSLEKGDLIFFATGKKKKQVTHAGIVTDTSKGNIIFIHSSTSLGVTEDNLNQAYWSKAFLFGRRIF
ncbi:C40 family peptidase [Aquiflexum sp. LQ15W]|uniref:C40 family peptidase n=1 Tax=Cognataquiflexum nitidum TaxID=2922272 RepID=UPI001F13390F|nr:C40 family peptidase [Cognataquiflexum nitidum]MCH6198441.1 C40 family peptidase [Cognataquiflexum nitidum]